MMRTSSIWIGSLQYGQILSTSISVAITPPRRCCSGSLAKSARSSNPASTGPSGRTTLSSEQLQRRRHPVERLLAHKRNTAASATSQHLRRELMERHYLDEAVLLGELGSVYRTGIQVGYPLPTVFLLHLDPDHVGDRFVASWQSILGILLSGFCEILATHEVVVGDIVLRIRRYALPVKVQVVDAPCNVGGLCDGEQPLRCPLDNIVWILFLHGVLLQPE